MHRLTKIGFALCVAAVLPVASWLVYVVSQRGTNVHEGVAEVPSGDFYEVPFTVWFDHNEVVYRFTVESDSAVDIYILSDEDFARYLSGQAVLERYFVHESTMSVSESPYLSKGSKHAVIDNTAYGVAVPDGSTCVVSYHVGAGGPPEVVYLRTALLWLTGQLSIAMFVIGYGLIAEGQKRTPAPRPMGDSKMRKGQGTPTPAAGAQLPEGEAEGRRAG